MTPEAQKIFDVVSKLPRVEREEFFEVMLLKMSDAELADMGQRWRSHPDPTISWEGIEVRLRELRRR